MVYLKALFNQFVADPLFSPNLVQPSLLPGK
jgi:hypothetical protein